MTLTDRSTAMQRQTTSHSGIDMVQSNGYMTAHALQRQAWQQDALALAEQKRALRAAGLISANPQGMSMFSRACAGFGSALIRIGARLQATGAPMTHSAH
jgi:hypothetical protein